LGPSEDDRGGPQGSGPESPLDIVLYVSPASATSVRARRNLEAVLESYEPAAFQLIVRDVSEHFAEAEADRIVFTPTLIVRSLEAPCTMVGDLADPRAVAMLLSMGGLEKSR
jgi:hypothetical protein